MIEWRKLLEQTHPNFQSIKKPDEVEWILSTGTLKNQIESIPDRLGFKIGEVAGHVGVKQYVLRYWESEFDELQPKKSKNGQRMYTKKDMETALAIKKLLHEDRFSIEGAKAALKKLRKQIKLSTKTDSRSPSPKTTDPSRLPDTIDTQKSHPANTQTATHPKQTNPPNQKMQISLPDQKKQMPKTKATTISSDKSSLEKSACSLLESVRQTRTSLNL